jgi:hypothetical protein
VTLAWVATNARDGAILADLPYLECSSVKRSIGRYEPASASLPLPNAPENWQLATRPGGANLHLLSDGVPIWGGMVTQRPKDLTDNLPLALATIESYLDRRLVGDVTYTGVGQNAIVADLFARFVVIGPHGGIPFRVQYATAGAGQVRDRSYLRTDRKTVYSALTELSAVLGGPEWTVEWETWIDGGGITHITPVLYVGDRVGTPVTPGLAPAATFDAPGCIIAAVMVEDYSSGKGANSVIAYSSATAGTVPTSPAQVAADDGRPTFEVDIQPSTSITDIATLTAHAQSALATLAPGGSALTMSVVVEKAPPLGSAWVLGDDVGYKIGGLEPDIHTHLVDVYADFWWSPDVWGSHWGIAGYSDLWSDIWSDTWGVFTGPQPALVNPNGRESVPAFPNGISGVMRAIGWELTLDGVMVVTPILASIGA